MITYLIRERDRAGQMIHLETLKDVKFELDEQYLDEHYGPGWYSILIAEQGKQGLNHYGEFVITPNLCDQIHFKSKPSIEEIEEALGPGIYYITRQTKAKVLLIEKKVNEPTEREFAILDKATDALPAITGYMVYKIDENNIKERIRPKKEA